MENLILGRVEEGDKTVLSPGDKGEGGRKEESMRSLVCVQACFLEAPAAGLLLTLSPGRVEVLTNQCPGSSLRNWLPSS